MLTAGVDEVGRGCLAGEVVSAAVILPINHGILGLNDSKKQDLIMNDFLKLNDCIHSWE